MLDYLQENQSPNIAFWKFSSFYLTFFRLFVSVWKSETTNVKGTVKKKQSISQYCKNAFVAKC